MSKRILIILLFACTQNLIAFSFAPENDSLKRYSIGLFGGGAYLWNKTSLPVLSFESSCGKFSDGNDISYYFGAKSSYEIIDGFLFASARILYESRPATLSSACSNFEVYDPSREEYVVLDEKYEFNGTLQYIALDAGIKIKPLREYPFLFRLSFEAGYPLIGTDYTTYESIENPLGITYNDGSIKKIAESGEIPDLGIASAAVGGVQAEIPILKNVMNDLYLVPEVSFRYGLNSIMSTHEWNVDILRAGIGLVWKFGAEIEEEVKEPEPEIPPDTTRPVIIAEDTISPNNALVETPKKSKINKFVAQPLFLDETIVTQTYPLLPYVFFDSSSYEIKGKYLQSVMGPGNFDEEKLPKFTLTIYYHILDIIGHRMSKNPGAGLKITGVTDGVEIKDPEERMMLAYKRALAVSEYLQKKWNIEYDRIEIDTQDVPTLPTNTIYSEGYEENRRIELSTDDPKILAPVVHSRFNEYKPLNNQFEITLGLNEPEKVVNCNIEFKFRGEKIKTYNCKGSPPREIKIPFDYDFILDLGGKMSPLDSLELTINLQREDNELTIAQTYLNVIHTPNNFEIGRLNLIVFDFDKSYISETNRMMIGEFIEKSIHDNSTTKITGSTDRLGGKIYNKNLSLERASSVKDYLMNLKPNLAIGAVKGVGDTNLLYNNDLPEGRFYCRTVLIEVKTPIK